MCVSLSATLQIAKDPYLTLLRQEEAQTQTKSDTPVCSSSQVSCLMAVVRECGDAAANDTAILDCKLWLPRAAQLLEPKASLSE
jgi:hypothetical protein